MQYHFKLTIIDRCEITIIDRLDLQFFWKKFLHFT